MQGTQNWSQLVQKLICVNEIFFRNTLVVILWFWGTHFQFFDKKKCQRLINCFLQVQRKDLRKTVCFKLYTFIDISRLSSRSFQTFDREKTGRVEKTEFYVSRGTFQRLSFLKKCFMLLLIWREAFPNIGRYLSTRLAKMLPTSPEKTFQENIGQKKVILQIFKFSPTSIQKFPELWRATFRMVVKTALSAT